MGAHEKRLQWATFFAKLKYATSLRYDIFKVLEMRVAKNPVINVQILFKSSINPLTTAPKI